MKYFYYLIILLLPLGELGRLNLGQEGINAHLFDLLLPGLVFLSLVYFFGVKRRFLLPPLSLPILTFVFIALFSLLVNSFNYDSNEVLISSLYLFRFVFYAFLYLVTYNLFKDQKDTPVKILLLIASLIIAVGGYVQYTLVPDFSEFAASYGWDPHQQRVLSTFFDPNLLASFFVLVLALVFGKILTSKKLAELAWWSAAGLVIVPAFVLTFSRTGYLAFAALVLVFGFLRSRALLLCSIGLFLIALVTIPRISERIQGGFSLDESASARVVSWKNAWTVFADHPFIGVGFNTYRYSQEQYGFLTGQNVETAHSGAGSDSSLLLVAATTGGFGLLFFIMIFIKEAYLAWGNFLRGKAIGLVTLGSLASLFISSQFVNGLFFPQIMAWYFILFALNDLEASQ